MNRYCVPFGSTLLRCRSASIITMKNIDLTTEYLMKFTASDSIRIAPVSSYTAHNGWFEINNISSNPETAIKAKKQPSKG